MSADLVERLLNRSPPPSRDDFIINFAATATDESDDDVTQLNHTSSPSSNKSAFESLPPDSTALILSFLLPHKLYDVSLTSKSGYDMFNCDLLWKIKFQSRWNCSPDMPMVIGDVVNKNNIGDDKSDYSAGAQYSNTAMNGFWKNAFINAHSFPHDLWIRHWNCVTPEDVTTVAGRTVIPTDYIAENCDDLMRRKLSCCWNSRKMNEQVGTEQNKIEDIIAFQQQFDPTIMKCCPTCRYHPVLHPNGYSNVKEAMEAELSHAAKQNENDTKIDHQADPVNTAEIVAGAHAMLCNSPLSTTAGLQSSASKAIHHATQYSVAKWCRNLRICEGNSSLLDRYSDQFQRSHAKLDTISSQSRVVNEAIRAFECASTYNRTIEASQYQSSGIQFLSDALFFNVQSNKKLSDQATMMKELGRKGGDSSSIPELGPKFETSHHTWHVIRLTNPDFILPLTFRAYIQCPDAFTVYPSEGYLQPGETIYLTLGVRMKAVMMNEAFERVDVEREEADAEMARLYAKEGHLPFVPFAIRYMYAPPVPVTPNDYTPRPSLNSTRRPPFRTSPTTQESVVDHLWGNVKSEGDVRTIYISAHINNNYVFEEFQHATLSTFNISTDLSDGDKNGLPLTTNMPQILQKSPQLISVIENLQKETEHSVSGDSYRTEKKCVLCKRDWGPQSELLGRAFLLRRLDCQIHVLRREQERADFERCMQMIPSLLDRVLSIETENDAYDLSSKVLDLNRICQLLYCMHTNHILPLKAKRFVSMEERLWYNQCESYVEETFTDVQQILCKYTPEDSRGSLVANGQKWKRRGIYEASKCTEPMTVVASSTAALMYKTEPIFLRKFRSLDHNPFGKMRLGVQDDPNHATDVSMHTDMFQNDTLKSFAIACLMMGNPKVLIGHGVYDRVKKPGSLIRCPSFPVDAYFRPVALKRHTRIVEVVRLLEKWAAIVGATEWSSKTSISTQQAYLGFKNINFEFNEQDPDGLSLIVLGKRNFQINFQTSMAHYISNVPLPGQGKLHLLSSPQPVQNTHFSEDIDLLYTTVQPYADILYPSIAEDEADNSDGESASQPNRNPANQNEDNDALLALNVMMLIAMHLGWTIDDDYRGGFLIVDRRLLIATQWFANTIMTASLLASLISRKILLINPFPVNGAMQAGYRESTSIRALSLQMASSQMRSSQRFLSPDECGVAALIVIIFYFYIGRLSEREIGIGYERQLVKNMNTFRRKKTSLPRRLIFTIQQLWDATVPYFIQRWTFVPAWSALSYNEMTQNVVHHRSMDHREHCIFDTKRSRWEGSKSQALGTGSYMIGFCCFLLSFALCSPHFSINSLTTFFCSVAYGMSLTIESFEIVRRTTSSGLLSLAKPRRLNTLVIGFILIGQLVGSSGGVLFLAEFIVTSISLILGGAATVTARAVESWITFLCLSSTSLWGFLSARLGLLDGMRKKQRGFPSNILCASLCSGVAMWITVLSDGGWNDVSPGEVIVVVLREQGRYWQSRFMQWFYS